jgi:hypothetical protein
MSHYVGLFRNKNCVNGGEFAGMIDLAVEVVSAITSGAAGSLGSKGAEAVGRLISALRAKLHGQPALSGTPEISVGKPSDAAARDNLVSMLREQISNDADFGAWLANLWNEIRLDLEADASRSTNVISGTVHGSAIQARDVKGGIHLGPASRE